MINMRRIVDMNKEGLQGASFGLMEGTIMIMGMLIGFGFAYPRRSMILLSIAMVGIADGLANATAFHVSEETEIFHRVKEIHKATLFCFLATILAFFLPSIPMIFMQRMPAMIFGEIIAVCMLIGVGIFVAEVTKKDVSRLIVEYTIMGVLAAAASYALGAFAATLA